MEIYIGHTNSLPYRLRRHNDNKVFSTKNRGPWSLLHTEGFQTRGEAMKREKQLKSNKGREWIKKNLLKK